MWDVASANYSEDDTALTILGKPVMERWEEPYMKTLATIAASKVDSSFDGILYDTYPLSEEDLHIHQFKFIEQAYRIIKPNGVLTYCNLMSWGNLKKQYPDDRNLFTETQITHLKTAGFSNFQTYIVQVNPTQSCQDYSTKTIVAPVIIK
ncbi:MAG: hypothetical protein F6K56_16195 [Moorea sp. SIO3G5]|nr:hypothetical protein [Moorena sp. SIO3G5]